MVMAGEPEALASELKMRKESRDCSAMDADLYGRIDLLGGRAFMAQNQKLGKEIGRKVEQVKSLYLTDKARFEKEATVLLSQYGQDAIDNAEKRRRLEKEIKEAEKSLETLISPAGRKALSTDLYEMRKELKALGNDSLEANSAIPPAGKRAQDDRVDDRIFDQGYNATYRAWKQNSKDLPRAPAKTDKVIWWAGVRKARDEIKKEDPKYKWNEVT